MVERMSIGTAALALKNWIGLGSESGVHIVCQSQFFSIFLFCLNDDADLK